jgi:hypothetical protein
VLAARSGLFWQYRTVKISLKIYVGKIKEKANSIQAMMEGREPINILLIGLPEMENDTTNRE